MQLLKEGTQIKPPAFRHRKIGSWSQARSSRSLTHSGETKDTRPTTTGSDYSHTVALLIPNPFIISNLLMNLELNTYRKVVNSSLSQLVARFQIFRRLMKGKFDAYVL